MAQESTRSGGAILGDILMALGESVTGVPFRQIIHPPPPPPTPEERAAATLQQMQAVLGGLGMSMPGATPGAQFGGQAGPAGLPSGFPRPGDSTTVQAPQLQGQPPIATIPQSQARPQGPSPLAGMRQRSGQRGQAQQTHPLAGMRQRSQQRQAQPQGGPIQQMRQRQQSTAGQPGQGGFRTSGPEALMTPEMMEEHGMVPLEGVLQNLQSIDISGNINDPNSVRVSLNQGEFDVLPPFETQTPAGIPIIVTPAVNKKTGAKTPLSVHMKPDFARVAGLVSQFTGHPVTSPLVALETNQLLAISAGEGGGESLKRALVELQQTGGFVMTQRSQAMLQRGQGLTPQGQQQPQGPLEQPLPLGGQPPSPESLRTGESISEEQGGPSMAERLARRQGAQAQTPTEPSEPTTVGDLTPDRPQQRPQSGMAGFFERQRQRDRQERLSEKVEDLKLASIEKSLPITQARSRAIVNLGNAIDSLAALGPRAGQNSEFAAALRTSMIRVPFFQVALESFGDFFSSPQETFDKIKSSIPAGDPINADEVARALGKKLEDPELRYIGAMNTILTDIRGFTGEARPTDYDTARVVRALGLQFFTTPRIAMANITALQEQIIRDFRSEVETIQRVSPSLLDLIDPNTPLNPYDVPPEWRKAAREINVRPTAQQREQQRGRGRATMGDTHSTIPESTITDQTPGVRID